MRETIEDTYKKFGFLPLDTPVIELSEVLGIRDSLFKKLADKSKLKISKSSLGKTVYGPTPEEIRLSSNPAVDITKVGNILAMVYDETVDPVATYTKAVTTALPSFEAADQVFIANVLDANI